MKCGILRHMKTLSKECAGPQIKSYCPVPVTKLSNCLIRTIHPLKHLPWRHTWDKVPSLVFPTTGVFHHLLCRLLLSQSMTFHGLRRLLPKPCTGQLASIPSRQSRSTKRKRQFLDPRLWIAQSSYTTFVRRRRSPRLFCSLHQMLFRGIQWRHSTLQSRMKITMLTSLT